LALKVRDLVDVDGKKVLRIMCQPATKPVFLKTDGREHLFIRIGAQTEALDGQALLDYVKGRF